MKRQNLFVLFSLLGVTLLACSLPALLVPSPTPTPIPTETPVPTPVPLYRQVTLESVDSSDEGQNPDYNIKLNTPVLRGSDDPRVQNFNTLAANIVQKGVDEFRGMLVDLPETPVTAASYYQVSYTLVSPPGNLLSLKFSVEGYIRGAAHPYHVEISLNYDLEKGQELSLDQLFLPGSDYLTPISQACITELNSRDIGFDSGWAQGAAPTPENYTVWNVTPQGLLITFNEYQVAPYAAGPQAITIPYSTLQSIIDPQGPLAWTK